MNFLIRFLSTKVIAESALISPNDARVKIFRKQALPGLISTLLIGCSGLDLATVGHPNREQSGQGDHKPTLDGTRMRAVNVELKTLADTHRGLERGRVVFRRQGKIVAGAQFAVVNYETIEIILPKDINVNDLRGASVEVRRNVQPLNLLFGEHHWTLSIKAVAANQNGTVLTLCGEKNVHLGGYKNWHTVSITHPSVSIAPRMPTKAVKSANQLSPLSSGTCTLDFPVNYPIDFSTLEAAVPFFYKDHFMAIADMKYEVWRRPLGTILVNGIIKLDLHLYYYLDGGNCCQCGWDDEPPLESDFAINSSFSWQMDWSLKTLTQIVSANHRNECKLTGANIDVTEETRSRIRKIVENSFAKLDGRMAEKSTFKLKAAQLYQAIQEAIELDTNTWLSIIPQQAVVGPVTSNLNVLSADFELSTRTTIVHGPKPVPVVIDLPDLQPVGQLPHSLPANSFEVFGRFNVTYGDVTSALRSPRAGLIGTSFDTQGKRARVRDISAYGTSNDELAIKLDVEGTDFTGQLCVVGKFSYDASERAIKLTDLSYDSNTRSELTSYADWLLQIGFVEQLKQTFSFPLGDQLDRDATKCTKALNRDLGNDTKMTGKMDGIDIQKMRFAKDVVCIDSDAKGSAQVTLLDSKAPIKLDTEGPPPERGWFIRIVPDEANQIGLMVGIGGVPNSRFFWTTWHRGDPIEFPVPIEFLHVRKLWVKGISRAQDGNDHPNAHVCFGFNDHIVQNMTFDDVEDQERIRSDHDDCQ